MAMSIQCNIEGMKKTCPFLAPTQVEFMTSMTLMRSRPFFTKNEHKSRNNVILAPNKVTIL